MGIGKCNTLYNVSRNSNTVSSGAVGSGDNISLILFYSIYNSFSFCIYIKIFKASCPFACCIQDQCLSCIRTTGIEPYSHGLRSDAVLILIVTPNLGNIYFRCFSFMCISQRIAVCCASRYTHLIAFNLGFAYCICYFCSIIKLRQFCKCICPFICFIQNRLITLPAIRKKLHAYAFRTDTILVIAVIPDLGHLNFSLFRCVSICDRKAVFSISCRGHGVIAQLAVCHAGLFHGINDRLARFLFGKILPDNRSILSILCDCLLLSDNSFPVCHKFKCYITAFTVSVIPVIPDLGRFNTDSSGGVGIGKLISV